MMKIQYFGHDCFEITGKTHSVLIDPFLSGNPLATKKPADFKPNLICVTHGHGDHLGDAVEISKNTGAPVLGVFELANYCGVKGAKAIGAHMGGTVSFEFGWVKLVPAWHSSSSPEGEYLGNPCGFVIHMEDCTIYHPGDTAVFSDMKLIAELTPVNVFLCPIGDHFTMGLKEAVKAVELVSPQWVIPMHYNTFDPIKQNPVIFKDMVEKESRAKVPILAPGETFELPAGVHAKA